METTNGKKRIGWDSLFKRGSVVDLDVRSWGAKTQIKLADLGIKDSDEVHKVLALGSHRLASKETFDKIREIANRAKRRVDYYSLNFPFVRGARFIPDENLEKLLPLLRGDKEEYDAESDRVANSIGEIRDERAPVILKALQDAAREQEIVQAAFNRIIAEYPTRDEVRRKYSMTWNIYSIGGSQSATVSDALDMETENVKSIVKSMVSQLREEFTDKLGSVMSAVAKGGKLSTATIKSAEEVITRIEDMNIFDDKALAEQCNALRRVISLAAEGNGTKRTGLITELNNIEKAIDDSNEAAIMEAEAALTGLGRRKVNIPQQEVG